MAKSFSDTLNRYMEINKTNKHRMYLELEEKGIITSTSLFYAYFTGESVPSSQKAKDILDAFGIAYSEKSLLESLEISKENKYSGKYEYKNAGWMKTGISLRVRSLSKKITTEEQIRYELWRRVEDTSNSFSEYISKLIQKDIDEQILDLKGPPDDP